MGASAAEPSSELLLQKPCCNGKQWSGCQTEGWKGKLGACSKASPSPCLFVLDFPSEGGTARALGWWVRVPAGGSVLCGCAGLHLKEKIIGGLLRRG